MNGISDSLGPNQVTPHEDLTTDDYVLNASLAFGAPSWARLRRIDFSSLDRDDSERIGYAETEFGVGFVLRRGETILTLDLGRRTEASR